MVLLTDKWLPCVPYLQLLCLNMAFYPIHTANLQAINALGKSDIYLKLEILKKVVTISILFFTIIFFNSIEIVILGGIIGTVIESIINAYPNKLIIDYSYIEQIKDISPSILITILMIILIYPISFLALKPLLTMALQIFLGAMIYFFFAKLFNIESFKYLIKTLRNYKNRKKIK